MMQHASPQPELTAETFLTTILDLEQLELNLFRGRNGRPDGRRRVFGGQVIAQALVAARRTVPLDRATHSLHGYFLLGGDPSLPTIYEVERIRDGQSFTTRRVMAIQHGKAIFTMSASFHVPEAGLSHQVAMPPVPPPEQLPDDDAWRRRILARFPHAARRDWMVMPALEVRPAGPHMSFEGIKAAVPDGIWMRSRTRLPDPLPIHQAVLAYASDMSLLQAGLLPHGRSVLEPQLQVASLDHALWFHQPFRADDWLLFVQDSPQASAARAFCRGQFFDRAGRLVASVAQEGLVRTPAA